MKPAALVFCMFAISCMPCIYTNNDICLVQSSTSNEVEFINKTVEGMLGEDYPLYGWNAYLYHDARELTEIIGRDPDLSCVTGTIFFNSKDIHSTPEAFAHELLHLKIESDNSSQQQGKSHEPDTGWTNEGQRLVNSVEQTVELPWNSELYCSGINRGQ